ncbi:MAG: 3-oxoacyl-[acyl-carrier-protein] reductase [Flavobacteriaceae bacterium]|nr:MAG: 3-oxoacyl-[acyl-carrier-protein] reductase [Flavobacteriaceae bacterium]
MKMLEGKVAIVTGATRGIGKAIATLFAQQGAKVVFTYASSKELAEELEKDLSQFGEVYSMQSAAEDFVAAEKLIDFTLEKFGQIDILVNNAGITKDNLLLRMSQEEFNQVVSTNLNSCFNLTKAACKTLLKQRFGSIINISSVVGLKGNAGQSNYAASKAGIIGFSKSIALELGSRNIRCNVVAPGFIQTEMTDKLDPKVVEQWAEAIAMKRGGTPKEVADACLFLASDLSSYITGQVLQVNGGMYT